MPRLPLRLLPAKRPDTPPAIWEAFAQMAKWKSAVLWAQLVIILVLLALCLRLVSRPPDVVVVSPEGESTYLSASSAPDALRRFLEESRRVPSDVTVAHFSKRFLSLALAQHPAVAREGWEELLALLSPGLRARVEQEAEETKLLSSLLLSPTRSTLALDGLELVRRSESHVWVKATVNRTKHPLDDEARAVPGAEETLLAELVLKVVPRSHARPDGLEVADWRIAPVSPAGTKETP